MEFLHCDDSENSHETEGCYPETRCDATCQFDVGQSEGVTSIQVVYLIGGKSELLRLEVWALDHQCQVRG